MSVWDSVETESAPAESLAVGDQIIHFDLIVTVTAEQEPCPNQFGLPWFKYRVEADDGRWGYAKFGPKGRAPRVIGVAA